MVTNEIKKALYREDPYADFVTAQSGHIVFEAETEEGVHYFKIPFSEIGETDFYQGIQAKYLIRWIDADYVKSNKLNY